MISPQFSGLFVKTEISMARAVLKVGLLGEKNYWDEIGMESLKTLRNDTAFQEKLILKNQAKSRDRER